MTFRTASLAALLSLATVANAQTAQHVTSQDGTRIAYEKHGKGPAVIIVGGALSDRKGGADLAKALAPNFTVITYDRRGRGGSGDTKPYSTEREVEDIDALIKSAGGSAHVFGKSSGAALALQSAATLGAKVRKLALYEAPYNDASGAAAEWKEFRVKLSAMLASGREEDAVAAFLKFVGMPDAALAKLKASPAWSGMVDMAPTLSYDNLLLGDDRAVPVAMAAMIKAETLVLDGGASAGPMPFMRDTADKLAKAIPGAQRRTIEGQAHDVSAEALAPILVEFFK